MSDEPPEPRYTPLRIIGVLITCAAIYFLPNHFKVGPLSVDRRHGAWNVGIR